MTAVPRSTGLFEAHLLVSDVERSIEFYRDVIGLPLALTVPERAAAFFWVGGPGRAMLGLWSVGSAPVGLSQHIALEASLSDVLVACDALRSRGITPLSFFGAEAAEPSVIGWMPAAAVYFRDPDGNLIEYLVMLDEPAHAERGIIPWSLWSNSDLTSVAVRVERFSGPRTELRALFEEAEDSAQELNRYIEAGEVLVAIKGGEIVGHLQLIDGADGTSEIKNMAVEAAHRGCGIGRALIDAAIDLTRANDRSTLIVATAAADIGNLRFYQRAGFRMLRIERDAFAPAVGYPAGLLVDGIRLRDRVWLDLALRSGEESTA
jgi:ribosomal protein S18 acetylase RimI-like enzyme/catechol 2,3-dioxygenase-like lactoylglutathione lyase family enzyme